tara:strand:+ start:158 stop:493 length:336 start_codon:yes stop_codon:yes gene_type:complete
MEKQEQPRPLIIRYVIAFIGAVAITIALLLFMNDLVSHFLLRDPTRYFAITSFIPAPDRGRQLPDAPPTPTNAPDVPELEYETAEEIIVDTPVAEVETELPPAGQPLNLEK